MLKKRLQYSKERIKDLHGFTKILFDKPILKFFIFVVIQFILTNFSSYIPNNFPLRFVIDILGILISIYFIAVIIYVIKNSITRLTNPQNLWSLIVTYALFILGILLLFSTLFSFFELSGLGYIKYGSCSDKFNPSMISADTSISREYFYFTGSTFFLLGYGDICPMGYTKYLAIFTAFIGHLVAVIVVTLVINNYLRKKEK
ncbi:hypothetical protein J4218_02135 [Candidatus Pacearchaeota archaeon]|nr:hypothetical protein [Candidatus Pacearchaeota archaeon]